MPRIPKEAHEGCPTKGGKEEQVKPKPDSSLTNSNSKTRSGSGTPTFRSKRYQNVEHVWNDKRFVKDKVRFIFGCMNEEKMDRLVCKKKKHLNLTNSSDLSDPEGLVLNDLCNPFRCNLFFSISEQARELPGRLNVVSFSGRWLSRVYRGSYDHFMDWIEDAQDYILKHYGKQVDPHRDWFAYYPSALANQKSPGEGIAVFFVKIADT